MEDRRRVRNPSFPEFGSHPRSFWVDCPYEWHEKCMRHAAIRQARDEKVGTAWRTGMKHNPHYDGLMSEMVTGHVLGLPVDFNSTRRDFKKDFVSRFGMRLDAKSTSVLNIPAVRVIDVDPQPCDIYVWLHNERDDPHDRHRITSGEMQGWSTWEEFREHGRPRTMRSGPCLLMPRRKLRDPTRLSLFLQRKTEKLVQQTFPW